MKPTITYNLDNWLDAIKGGMASVLNHAQIRVHSNVIQLAMTSVKSVEMDFGHRMGVALSTRLVEQLSGKPSMTLKYPATWWEAFKETYFPIWLLKYFPIIWECQTIEGHLLFPGFDPEQGTSGCAVIKLRKI